MNALKPWNVPSLSIHETSVPVKTMDPGSSSLVKGKLLLPNSDEPIPFENDHFKGQILFLLRTDPQPPKWSHLFAGRRRTFWIQLQGQFKKSPQGQVYIGGEVPRKMQLGVITRSFCSILLRVLNMLVVGLHYSLGQSAPEVENQVSNEELGHICFPLHSSVDEFVCTPAGQVPPALGQDNFGETSEARAHRKAAKELYRYNTHDTYTFSFFSYYIDFVEWKVVHVPGLPMINLERFWNDMPLRIVSYSVAAEQGTEQRHKKEAHTQQDKEYYMCVEMNPSAIVATRR
ncbi:unnamed protein product [Aphanomyces euteiches]|uniref:Domain of unknown function at the cortex 1 domain-containing protein n=1 Tax=Aphanomyces euteiches TaxID=100861 RepID=A0A6G0XGD3_9STRA|nr:hypothetical protein Ae201684_005291 [Aphanomyces euteiches]KAH9053558.1 hypothetical protein Ae201684P_015323 [Aphanomyces euteiches]KAH9144967.1 hypothetical protein AeRB84_011105 [Aphanomyces euteiches]